MKQQQPRELECPFCTETFDGDDIVFEFKFGDIAMHFYRTGQIGTEPPREYRDRPIYITMSYDSRGNAWMNSCSTTVNPEKHMGTDPMCEPSTGWPEIVQLMSKKSMFSVYCEKKNPLLPTKASFLPLSKRRMRHSEEGASTGTYCPYCEQLLKPEVMNTRREVRIVCVGRRSSGKTVYITQLIRALVEGHDNAEFTLEGANSSVDLHYQANLERLNTFATGFVPATNPVGTQDPYVYLMKKGRRKVRLVIQDIAGEDTNDHVKYNSAIHKADMLLFFVDPWHIQELRQAHRDLEDFDTNQVVDQAVGDRVLNLDGIFNQMLSSVDQEFTSDRKQLAAVLLIKGDYLIPSMLEDGDDPQCSMMRQGIDFLNPDQMEFAIGMRSAFIRQCLNEWGSTRAFVRNLEGKYAPSNVRYFTASALGHSTRLRHSAEHRSAQTNAAEDDQFGVSGATGASTAWNSNEQVLEAPPAPRHVIDPVYWCLKRRGVYLEQAEDR